MPNTYFSIYLDIILLAIFSPTLTHTLDIAGIELMSINTVIICISRCHILWAICRDIANADMEICSSGTVCDLSERLYMEYPLLWTDFIIFYGTGHDVLKTIVVSGLRKFEMSFCGPMFPCNCLTYWSCENEYIIGWHEKSVDMKNVNRVSETRRRVKIVIFIVIYWLCRVRNKMMYVLSWQIVYAPIRVLF